MTAETTMNEDNPINSLLVWRQALAARIRANDPNMSAEERAKLADVLDSVQPNPASPPKNGKEKTMNDTERDNNRLLTILEAYANELTAKAELLRFLGKQLISLDRQSESDYRVDWIVRTGSDDRSLIEIELALLGLGPLERVRFVTKLETSRSAIKFPVNFLPRHGSCRLFHWRVSRAQGL